eukprot:CAMPEP_0194193742 /NCGR_PEP_ID=MMETSP0154-20130528/75202_1 /TAXON_ID=1049557 /ORGANISM="Thalassiothrix antarctica, Strain L6-D1" /LENGTH=485 /DNA_ID=CAMNT_0038918107 /DNA_START=162 /DNA_END=1620 /DNA_ORIENTATION=+
MDDGDQPKKRSRLSNEIETHIRDDDSLFRFQMMTQNKKLPMNKDIENEEQPKIELSRVRRMNTSAQEKIALNSTLTKSNELDFIIDHNAVQYGGKEDLSSPISSRTLTSKSLNPDEPVIYPIPSKLKPQDPNKEDSNLPSNQGDIAVSPVNPFINLSSFISNYTQNLQANFTLPLITNQHAINTFPATSNRLVFMPNPEGISQYQQVMMNNIPNQSHSLVPLIISNQASVLANPQQQLQKVAMPNPQGISQYQQVMMNNISNQSHSLVPLIISNQASNPQGISQYQQVMMNNISNQSHSNVPLMISNQASVLANPQQQLQNTTNVMHTQSEDVRKAVGIQGPLLYISTDDEVLSDYQILLRKQIEFFEASFSDVGKTSCGRRRPIMMNQVGIRCYHCKFVPIEDRKNGTIYYPSKLTSIYQAAQNMTVTHLLRNCHLIDENIKKQLQTYQQGPSTTGHGGKKYWAETAKAQGIKESNEGYLQFCA